MGMESGYFCFDLHPVCPYYLLFFLPALWRALLFSEHRYNCEISACSLPLTHMCHSTRFSKHIIFPHSGCPDTQHTANL